MDRSTLLALAAVLLLLRPTPALAGATPDIADNSGAFTHQIPLPVPDGPAGATPELRLVYSSGAANGNAGVGWSLPYSAIRLDQTWGVPARWLDGADPCDPVSFEGRLWLDGAELIPSRTDPLAAGTCTFRTRPDSFSLVVPVFADQHCTDSDGPNVDLPTGFAVVRNDGTTWWYGGTTCGALHVDRADDGTPVRWLLQHVQDRDGNLVTWWPERGTGPADPELQSWWSDAPSENSTAGCDGCLRAVTWAKPIKDGGPYAFGAQIAGSPADAVTLPSQHHYANLQGGLTNQFQPFLHDPASFWPADQSHVYVARVDWEPRPDIRTSFMSGAASRLDRRIRQVAVFADARVERTPDDTVDFSALQTPIRTFRLDYDQGTTGRSRLVRVWPIAGQYAEDADYSAAFGAGFPQDGFTHWDPQVHLGNPLVPNPWELVWSDSTVLDPIDPTVGEWDVAMPLVDSDQPWLGAQWGEGGFPTVSMMDLNGDSLPELVQHDELLPKQLTAADNLMQFLSPYADFVFGANEDGVADDGEASTRFHVRWNQGDGFSELTDGPVDPFALQEVADWMLRGEAMLDGPGLPWEEVLPGLGQADSAAFEDLPYSDYLDIAGADAICGLWWTGLNSLGAQTGVPLVPHFPPAVAAWCEHRSCAPYCEAGTTVTWSPWAMSGAGAVPNLTPDHTFYRQTTKQPQAEGGYSGGELVLWRKYGVSRATSGTAASTASSLPFGQDPILGAANPLAFEPRTITRWVDGYARASFQSRIVSEDVELLRRHEAALDQHVDPTEATWLKVRDGVVHDTFDINGDGFPDRVLGGAGLLEYRLGEWPTTYTAPNEAILNPLLDAPKSMVASTQHMPWVVALFDPETGEFGDLHLWELPLTHPWLLGGPDTFPDPSLPADEPDPRLFGFEGDYNFLEVWESSARASSAPVSSNASLSFGASGVSAGMSASIGPVSVGGSVSGGQFSASVGVGPVSFSSGSMSVGPVQIDFSKGVQTGASAAVGAAFFVITKALEIIEVPWNVGISMTPDGATAAMGPYGSDCIACSTTIRWKRQGLVDLNGDGLPDYVRARTGAEDAEEIDWIVIFNEGDGFAEEPVVWSGVRTEYMEATLTDPYRDAAGANTRPGFRRSQKVAGLQDMNADGLVDFVYTGRREETGCRAAIEAPWSKEDGPRWDWLRRFDGIDTALTLCVQLNVGHGFAEPVSWFPFAATPGEVFTEPGIVPSLSASHLLTDRSPLYNDGFGVGLIGLNDVNGDGLPDFTVMREAEGKAEARIPLVFLNNGRHFATNDLTDTDRYGRFVLDVDRMRNDQIHPNGLAGNRLDTAYPVIDVSRTHRRPGGPVIQSAFTDLDGDGRLDWAQSHESPLDDGDGSAFIRLYQLQDAVPDLLIQLWEPGGGAQRMTYAPARDFMDLPFAPESTTLADHSPLTDDLEDSYPASAQVVISTTIYDGLGDRGSAPVTTHFLYGDPRQVHADPALTAGLGITHPSFRRRSLGFARVVAEAGTGDVTVVQEYGSDWHDAALPYERRIIDGHGNVRGVTRSEWDHAAFAGNYDVDPRFESALGVFNWHLAPVLVTEAAYDAWGSPITTHVRTDYDDRNGMATCVWTDLDGDQWADRLDWTHWDGGLIDDGMRDAAEEEGVALLPLGKQNVFDPSSCTERDDVFNNNYAVRRTLHDRFDSGRVHRSTTYDVATAQLLTETVDYLPNGQPYLKEDTAGALWWTLYDPEVGVAPVADLGPPNLQAGVEFLATREVCGLTMPCPNAAWGQVPEETDPNGLRRSVKFDALGRPVQAGDDLHAERIETVYGRPVRLVPVDAEPIGAGGGLPAYVAVKKPVAPGVDVWTHTWTDGVGRTLLAAEDWEDEFGSPGQRLAGGELRDGRGRVEEQPWPCFLPGGGMASQASWLLFDPSAADLGLCDSDPPRERFVYDDLSRVERHERPDGSWVETHRSHHGGGEFVATKLFDVGGAQLTWTTTWTNALSRWTSRYGADTWRHDAQAGGLPGGVTQDQSELHTEEVLDALGRRTSVWRTGQGSERTEFRWDGFDRLIGYADPDQGSWELTYDGAGRLESRALVDPATGGVELGMEWAYDGQGRVLTEWSYDDAQSWANGAPTAWWEWTYDVDPGSLAPNGPMPAGGERGRASEATRYVQSACGHPSAADVQQVLSWRYDRRGRVVEEAQVLSACDWAPTSAPQALVAQHEWTAGDQRRRTWMPWGSEVLSWTYDGAGRPQAVKDAAGVVAEARYEIQGRLARISMRNGVEQQYVYTQGVNSTQALDAALVWSGQGLLFGRDYEWDAAGNLLSWDDAATLNGPDAESWDCTYDDIGALLGCENRLQPEWFDYRYDVLGNLVHEDVQTEAGARVASQYARGTQGLPPVPGVAPPPLNAPVARVATDPTSPSPDQAGQSFLYDGRGHLVGQRYHDPLASHGGLATEAGLAGPSMQPLAHGWERIFDWNAQGRLNSVAVRGPAGPMQVSAYWYTPDGDRMAERVTPRPNAPHPEWTQSRRWAGVRTVEPEHGDPHYTLSVSLGGTTVAQKTVEPNPLQPGQQKETWRYLAGDHLGSASIVTDEHGDLMRGVRYEPYGRIRDEWGPDANSDDYQVASVDELFNGKPRTREAFGLNDTEYALEGYDYGARIYLPELSRWASADSITPDVVWSPNHFAYVRNNPLKYVDPDGHWEALADALAGAKTEELYDRHGQGSQYIRDRRTENVAGGIGAALGFLGWSPLVHQTLAAWGAAADATVFGPALALQFEVTVGANLGVLAAKLRLAAMGTAMAKVLAESTDAQVYVRSLAMSIAKAIKTSPNISKKKTPTAVTVVYDRVQDRVFVGMSGEVMDKQKAEILVDIAPDLQRQMPDESLELWPVANCAEIAACNKALRQGSRMEDLDMYTVDVRALEPKSRCKNCLESTKGIDSQSDTEVP